MKTLSIVEANVRPSPKAISFMTAPDQKEETFSYHWFYVDSAVHRWFQLRVRNVVCLLHLVRAPTVSF